MEMIIGMIKIMTLNNALCEYRLILNVYFIKLFLMLRQGVGILNETKDKTKKRKIFLAVFLTKKDLSRGLHRL